MKTKGFSLYIALGIIIFTTVIIIMSTNSALSYKHTKEQTIQDMKDSSNKTILSIKDNIENLIAAYAVNEYNNLIQNEISRKDIFAIVIKDYNMGKILGEESLISGKIKYSNSDIIDYNPTVQKQNDELKNCFYSETYDIVSTSNKKLGTVSIYISDETMKKELTEIIYANIKNSLILSFFLIISLFITIKFFILNHLSNMINTIGQRDDDGIPTKLVANSKFVEINELSKSINQMISSVKKSRDRLHESLKLQKTIFDNSGYMIIRTDENGIIQQLNKEAEAALEYSEFELIDRYTPEIIHLKEEVEVKAKEFSKELNQNIEPGFEVFISKSNLGLENEHEWTYVTKSGKHIPVQLSVSTLKNKNNETYGYLGVARDITQTKLIESQSKLASMGEMIGNIAHQWRQPLSVISTLASGAKFKSEYKLLDEKEFREDMDSITKQTQYLSKTIDDFRDFIKNKNTKEDINISTLVEKTTSILKSALKNNNITVIEKIEADLNIKGFENQLIQALINIINNSKDALKENIPDSEERLIFITTQKGKNHLVLSIKDNAGGIKKEILDKVFDPYFTTKHKSIGTGIGLSMTHQIITKHHNATIEALNTSYTYNNDEVTGACFKISFRD